MAREHLRINRFGFAEYVEDYEEVSAEGQAPVRASALRSIVDLVFSEDDLFESFSDAAQASFLVPLGMASRMLDDGDYTPVELAAAVRTVRSCGVAYVSEFPDELAELMLQLPR